MASFSTYSELQAELIDWMARTDVTGKAETFIGLAEARLNRLLGPVAATANLTGVADSNLIDISSLPMVLPVSLYMMVNEVERFIPPQALGTFYEQNTSAVPSSWAISGTNIRFDCPLDGVYPARFTYQGRFALSDDVPANEFLTNYPDVYLAAAIIWGAAYTRDANGYGAWKAILDEGLAEAKSTIAQSKRGTLTVDPMLIRGAGYNFNTDTTL